MALNEEALFPRGKTYGTTTVTDGVEWEGREFDFPDIDWATGSRRSDHIVTCRVVRNVGAAVLLPKRLARFQATAGVNRTRMDGYATLTAAEAYPVDEFLPAAGVAVNDLFYIVVRGPATVLTDLAGADNNVVSVGGKLVALTGATSGSTTSGRVAPHDLTGATALLANQVLNWIGTAMSAKTTANTNADLLVFMRTVD